MKLLVLSGADVRALLAPGDTAHAMRAALTALARGEVDQPLRTMFKPERAAGLMGLMPAHLSGRDPAFAVKAICVLPGNPARGLDSHQGVVLLSSAETGEPLALLNASAVTEIRTAAVSAVATAVLARADATELAIIGTGVQARAHLLAISAARPLTAVRVAGRDAARAERFAADVIRPARPSGLAGLPVTACSSAEAAVAGAGIVVTATSSAEPVLRRGWLASGTHINAVGACLPRHRELDAQTVAAAGFFADSRESVRGESGDFLLALAEGAIGPGHIRAELGEILIGAAPGRADDDEITVFESLGVAVEDLAAAALAYRKAAESGAGAWLEF
jgi:ornithine cyclodeaminase/alanine dehydrogenase-like protein (mu-crystallin family)